MRDHGCFALRFHKDKNIGEGRCWVIPWDGNLVMLNSYSTRGQSLLSMVRILSTITGMYYRKVTSLYNFGTDTGILYINGARGYVLGEEEKVVNLSEIDMAIHCPDEQRNYCEYCEESYDEEDGYYVDSGR